jgi:hypothetical protein
LVGLPSASPSLAPARSRRLASSRIERRTDPWSSWRSGGRSCRPVLGLDGSRGPGFARGLLARRRSPWGHPWPLGPKRGVTPPASMRSSLRTTVSTHGEGIGWTFPTHVGRGAELDRLTHVLEEFAGVGAELAISLPLQLSCRACHEDTSSITPKPPGAPGSFGIRTVRGGHFGYSAAPAPLGHAGSVCSPRCLRMTPSSISASLGCAQPTVASGSRGA